VQDPPFDVDVPMVEHGEVGLVLEHRLPVDLAVRVAPVACGTEGDWRVAFGDPVAAQLGNQVA
jgi:hypothetical protein